VGKHSGSIKVDRIGAIVIRGSLIGTSTNPVLIVATGDPNAVQEQIKTKPVWETRTRFVVVRVPTPNCGFIDTVRTNNYTVKVFLRERFKTPSPILGNIKNLIVDGNVQFAQVLAGENGHIGTIKVKGDWTASTVAAGVQAGDDGKFGTADDLAIISAAPMTHNKIDRIEIGGRVVGTPSGVNSKDHYGFVAREIGAFKVGSKSFALTAGPGNDNFAVGTTGDVRLRELQLVSAALIGISVEFQTFDESTERLRRGQRRS